VRSGNRTVERRTPTPPHTTPNECWIHSRMLLCYCKTQRLSIDSYISIAVYIPSTSLLYFDRTWCLYLSFFPYGNKSSDPNFYEWNAIKNSMDNTYRYSQCTRYCLLRFVRSFPRLISGMLKPISFQKIVVEFFCQHNL